MGGSLGPEYEELPSAWVLTRPSQCLEPPPQLALSKIHMQSLLATTISSVRISKDGARAQGFGKHVSGIFVVLPFLAPSSPTRMGAHLGA